MTNSQSKHDFGDQQTDTGGCRPSICAEGGAFDTFFYLTAITTVSVVIALDIVGIVTMVNIYSPG